jgi:hypothetical protein
MQRWYVLHLNFVKKKKIEKKKKKNPSYSSQAIYCDLSDQFIYEKSFNSMC